MACSTTVSRLSDDLLITIFTKLDADPRHWARLSCVCSRFSSLIRNVCCKDKCSLIPFLPITNTQQPPGGWAALHKLSVCCPGLTHAGVLLENSDFGLELDIGPNQITHKEPPPPPPQQQQQPFDSLPNSLDAPSDPGWTMFDDLHFDTVYDLSESDISMAKFVEEPNKATFIAEELCEPPNKTRMQQQQHTIQQTRAHLAAAKWSPSREQGNKLLAARFHDDCLYLCEWPGCVHVEEKREYMLFRGVFKHFKKSGVWRTIMDGRRKGSGLGCAFCGCKETWDLHSAFCLRRVFGYHDDGEPVVRAYVCENGHVSGAWTEMPLQ